MKSPILTKKFDEGIKKVGPGCDFEYPISDEELKSIKEMEKKNGKQ